MLMYRVGLKQNLLKAVCLKNLHLGSQRGGLYYKYNNFGDLPYDVGKFDLKMIGNGNEGVSLNRKDSTIYCRIILYR